MVLEGDLTWGDKHTIQYIDNIEFYTLNLYNCINQCHSNKFNKKNKMLIIKYACQV